MTLGNIGNESCIAAFAPCRTGNDPYDGINQSAVQRAPQYRQILPRNGGRHQRCFTFHSGFSAQVLSKRKWGKTRSNIQLSRRFFAARATSAPARRDKAPHTCGLCISRNVANRPRPFRSPLPGGGLCHSVRFSLAISFACSCATAQAFSQWAVTDDPKLRANRSVLVTFPRRQRQRNFLYERKS